MAGIYRINKAIEINKNHRFQVLFGSGIEDVFLNIAGYELNFEQALFETLSSKGYERIIFFSPHRSIFALDEKSAEFLHPQADNYSGNMESGPLKSYKAFITNKQVDQNTMGMGDAHAIRIMDSLMRDENGVKTAIIFLQTETLFKNFDNRRILAGLVGEWFHLGSKNRNSCFFTFSCDDYETLEVVGQEQPIPELRNMILNNKDCLSQIGSAGEDEIEISLQKLKVNCRITDYDPKIIQTLFQEGKSLRSWLLSFNEPRIKNKSVNYQLAAQMGWLSSVRDPEKSASQKLNDLIGLDNVKQRVNELISWRKIKSKKGSTKEDLPNLHMIFSGNPGTGKTTVARLIGEIYHEIGWLQRGHLVEAQAGDLIAEYVGGTSLKTNKLIDEALGGILFIDEAYGLIEDERGGFNREALETLLSRMETDRDKFIVICAGYVDKMVHFRKANPGLSRRFPNENVIHFEDYDEVSLLKIAKEMLISRQLVIDDGFESLIKSIIHEMHQQRDHNFGNAGEMRNLTEAIDRIHSARIISDNLSVNTPLGLNDIPETYRVYIPLYNMAKNGYHWMDELDPLIGLDNIKMELHNLEKRLDFERLRYQSIKIETVRPQVQNFVFTGNPGTGKTTVARLLGKMYKELGLLGKGHVVEVSRVDLVAGFVGQTAIKTQKVIESALDGVLFIDEAYSLENGSENDYGREAIMTLVKSMEDFRGRIGFVVAGYPDEMQIFLESNPGLASRFRDPLEFSDFTLDELWQILSGYMIKEGYSAQDDLKESVIKYLEWMKIRDGNRFGNARSVRILFENIKTNASSRIMDGIRKGTFLPSPEVLSTLYQADVPEPGYYLELGPIATTKANANARV